MNIYEIIDLLGEALGVELTLHIMPQRTMVASRTKYTYTLYKVNGETEKLLEYTCMDVNREQSDKRFLVDLFSHLSNGL